MQPPNPGSQPDAFNPHAFRMQSEQRRSEVPQEGDKVFETWFCRFTPGQVADCLIGGYALQMNEFYPSLQEDEKAQVETTVEKAGRTIALAAIDAITREVVGVGGGTLAEGSLAERPDMVQLAARLIADKPEYIAAGRAIFETHDGGRRNMLRSNFIPEPVESAVIGMRAKAADIAAQEDLPDMRELARDVAGACETLFAEWSAAIAEETGSSEINQGWTGFAKALAKYGYSETTAERLMAIDGLLWAQHAGSNFDGSMLGHTSNDFATTFSLLEATREHSRTPEIKPFVSPDLLEITQQHPKLDLFAQNG